MTDFLQRIKDLPANKLALLAAQLQERLEQAEGKLADAAEAGDAHGPIAVVGVGCRFPGDADDPDAYWQVLIDGTDAIREVPAERWDVDALYDPDWQVEGKMASRWGGFLDGVDRFDARLFGISPREAVSIDPQQRLLLEVAHQALERAGIAPGSLAESRTGVFVGLSSTDYLQLQNRRGLSAIDGYLASGAAPSVAAGRVSYLLGLHGPALTVDTACSSSLVAVHLAVQALRTGQCENAIAAGVNVILSPVTTIALSKAQMMAPDGRCKTFSAAADGFVRGEGCGVVVLKRLADAVRDRDPIVGVIRGTALNQDGRSNGLTAPNGPAQEAVLAEALADAGLRPADIGYVEAHGTGTRLGDPIEIQALGAVLGQERPPDRRLAVGSVKTNFGHLESAAGIAGLIKAMLVLEHGVIPAHQHLDEPSPVIPWDALPIDVPTVNTPWRPGQARFAGVSSFGFSGTNAHVIVEAPPAAAPAPAAGRELAHAVEVLALSAQSPEALRELAERHLRHIETHELALTELCRTLNTGRDVHPHREAYVVGTVAELHEELAVRSTGGSPRRVVRDHVETTRPARPVWLFTGQGSQYPGMGRELFDLEPVFADVLRRCDEILREQFAVPLLDVMFAPDDARLHQTAYTQPALFSLEVALAALWRSWGVVPGAVMGHSVGEYAAAHVAGLFSLEDGLALIARRGQLMQALPSGGRMVAVLTSREVVEELIEPHRRAVAIAAVNGPTNVVISGEGAAVQAVLEGLDALDRGVETRELQVSHAFHSPAMDGIVDPFHIAAGKVDFADPAIPIVSNVTGDLADRDVLGHADYWSRHVREPVQFGPAIAALAALRHRIFLEIGPQPVLVGMAAQCLDDPALRWAHSLRKGRSDPLEMAGAMATLWTSGVALDWDRWHGDTRTTRLILPTYPMQRERYWIDGVAPWGAPLGQAPAPADETDGLVYEVTWEPGAHPSIASVAPGAFLAPVERVAATLDAVAPEIAATNGIAGYDEFLPRLDALCTAYVVAGLTRLGLRLDLGHRFTAEEALDQMAVVPAHHRLVRRMLDILAEDGWLQADGDTWVGSRQEEVDPDSLGAPLLAGYADYAAEVQLVQQCGIALPGILRGEIDALDVLFPGGSSAQMEGIYRRSPMARTFNEIVARAVEAATKDIPRGRALRVLEVGAGSGSTTDAVLPVLAGHDVDYLFTDISAAFTGKARARYRDRPFVRFGTLDASRDLAEQGYAPGAFDLIVAANVIHATADLRTTVTNLRHLLAPGGQIVLLEATTRERFADLTVGFTPGWWAFEDVELRPDYALLDRATWGSLLTDCGFAATAAGPTDVGQPALRREAVVVAAAPWDTQEEGSGGSQPSPGHLVLVGTGAVAAAIAAAHRDAGGAVVAVDRDDPTAVRAAIASSVSAGDPSSAEPPARVDVMVVVEPAAGGPDDQQDDQQQTIAVLATIQALLATPSAPPIWIVTRGAQGVGRAGVPHVDGASVWGVGHVVALEHPELDCRLLDLDDEPLAEAARRVVTELCAPDQGEPQLAWRGGERLVRRLTSSALPAGTEVALDPAASYLVSGGLRGIGLLVAGWLVEHGARQLVLFGRNAPSEEAAVTIEQWRQGGTTVEVLQADAGVDGDIERVVATATALGPLKGVVHSAGALADAALVRQDWDHFRTTFGPKVFGTRSLLRHLDASKLDFLVLFSSGAGVAGSPGQANHAAANAYLDALAHDLRDQGVKALSIDWGAWTEVGAAADRGIDRAPGAFSPAQGLTVLGRAIGGLASGTTPPQLLVHGADWGDVLARHEGSRLPALYRELILRPDVAAAPGRPTAANVPVVDLRAKLAGLGDRRRRMVLRDEVRSIAAQVLDVQDPDLIEPGQPLHDMGLDSLMAVEVRNRLGAAVGEELPATLLFEHPSVVALVDFLLDGPLAPDPAVAGVVGDTPTPATPIPTEAPRAPAEPQDAGDLASMLAARLDRLGERR